MTRKGETYDSTYVFSSDQQEEVKKIYQKYAPREAGKKMLSEEEEKMERLRKLDRSVTRAGAIAALASGLCGGVIHGIGTALIQDETTFALGTVIAVIGLALFLASYPACCFAGKKQRSKVEAEIRKLCKELMK